jgi:signal transduction histidine kinase
MGIFTGRNVAENQHFTIEGMAVVREESAGLSGLRSNKNGHDRITNNLDDPMTHTRGSNVNPEHAIVATQSLKPYARSLSHELRTPMHGVIGMLDVMHAKVQEAIEAQDNPKIGIIFQALKENIEVVQGTTCYPFLRHLVLTHAQIVLVEPSKQQTILSKHTK